MLPGLEETRLLIYPQHSLRALPCGLQSVHFHVPAWFYTVCWRFHKPSQSIFHTFQISVQTLCYQEGLSDNRCDSICSGGQQSKISLSGPKSWHQPAWAPSGGSKGESLTFPASRSC